MVLENPFYTPEKQFPAAAHWGAIHRPVSSGGLFAAGVGGGDSRQPPRRPTKDQEKERHVPTEGGAFPFPSWVPMAPVAMRAPEGASGGGTSRTDHWR